jgi:hypothetical protein
MTSAMNRLPRDVSVHLFQRTAAGRTVPDAAAISAT